MKKYILILILLLLLSSYTFATEEETEVITVETSVSLNGDFIQGDAKHLLIGDRVFIVARTISDALNQEILWLPESQQVEIISESSRIILTIGQSTVYFNDQAYNFDAAPFLLNGRTYIPVRMVSELLGCKVDWHGSTYTVLITKENFEMDEKFIFNRSYTDEDLLWLSRIVHVESDFDSIPMKLGIANVVLNRVKDPRFPNSVHDVIFDNQYATQFPPAHKESFSSLKADPLSILASKKALEGHNNIQNCLYFNNAPFKSRTDDLFIIIDGEYFYN